MALRGHRRGAGYVTRTREGFVLAFDRFEAEGRVAEGRVNSVTTVRQTRS